MTCYRCKKNPAVVFMTVFENGKPENKGLCIKCAKELKIGNIDKILEKMGMTDEDIENMSSEIAEFIGDGEGTDFISNIIDSLRPDANPKNELSGEDDDDDGTGIIHLTGDDDVKLGGGFGGGRSENAGAGGHAGTQQKVKNPKRKHLETYCVNLTALAKEGKLDKIVGREAELKRVIQILNRRTKNNPCLIGEPGVGKTAIAEGLAQRIVEGKVPPKLIDKEIFLLDLTALVVKTQFRGQFEGRVKGLIDEIKESKNVILMIDEVHNMVSAGDAEGSMSAGNILKPALSRGEVQIIGATTFNEYRKHIEKDAALERRFQPVKVGEPTIEQSAEILRGVRKYYEDFHGVRYSDDVIRLAVELSERYVTDRYLPDKAIDLIDEAGSYVNLNNVPRLEIEMLENDLDTLRREKDALVASDAPTQDVFERIATIRSEECRIEDKIMELKKSGGGIADVTIDDLAMVIELWTGIPASKVSQQEFKRLSRLGDALREKIVGQDEAIDAIVSAIKRNRAGVASKRKPVSMIFAGSTGVGKTELVKTIAAQLFDGVDSLIRLDMSEYMEKHSVSRIIGSPPGYVGYDEAGQVTEKVRRRPYSVILFDEIEKAHKDVLNILLQILDDGKITDAQGRLVNFENTIIIMTTNAGSEKRSAVMGFESEKGSIGKNQTMKALESFLRPEFINRVDEIITFNRLTRENFLSIADIMLGEFAAELSKKQIKVEFEDGVREFICEQSFSEKYGARNLRRFIQKNIEDKAANLLIENYDRKLDTIVIGVKDGAIEAHVKN
ncbi:MAG: ATP-dependent Clp protease ATP-binding subunit [Clostridia bacterium]|nr:ATP-dependent Clp protease ATP-binding subunit [Clostridia bacterium]